MLTLPLKLANAIDNEEPLVWVLVLELDSQTLYYSTSEIGIITTTKEIQSIDNIESGVDITEGGGIGWVSNAVITFNEICIPEGLHTKFSPFSGEEIINRVARLGVTSKDCNAESDILFLHRFIIDESPFTRENITLTLVDSSELDNVKIPQKVIDAATFPNAPKENVGKPLPIVYGDFYTPQFWGEITGEINFNRKYRLAPAICVDKDILEFVAAGHECSQKLIESANNKDIVYYKLGKFFGKVRSVHAYPDVFINASHTLLGNITKFSLLKDNLFVSVYVVPELATTNEDVNAKYAVDESFDTKVLLYQADSSTPNPTPTKHLRFICTGLEGIKNLTIFPANFGFYDEFGRLKLLIAHWQDGLLNNSRTDTMSLDWLNLKTGASGRPLALQGSPPGSFEQISVGGTGNIISYYSFLPQSNSFLKDLSPSDIANIVWDFYLTNTLKSQSEFHLRGIAMHFTMLVGAENVSSIVGKIPAPKDVGGFFDKWLGSFADIDSISSNFFLAVKGRRYGNWITENGRSVGYSSSDCIEQPAYIIESILREEMKVPSSRINTTSFDTIGNSINGLRKDWKFIRSITSFENARDVIKRICYEAHLILFESNGKYKLVALDKNENTPFIIEQNQMSSAPIIERTHTALLRNRFTVGYQYSYASNTFEKTMVCTEDYSSPAMNEVSLCKVSQETYRVKNLHEDNLLWINDETTAQMFLEKKIHWQAFPHLVTSIVGWWGTSSSVTRKPLIQYELGEQCKISHPLLIDGSGVNLDVSNTVVFMVVDKVIDKQNRSVELKLFSMPSDIFISAQGGEIITTNNNEWLIPT